VSAAAVRGFRERLVAAASLLLLGEDRTTPPPPPRAPRAALELNELSVPLLGASQAGFPIRPPADLADMPEAYSLLPSVYAGVYAIAHAFASIPLVVNRRTADGPQAVPDHELLRLLSPEYGIPNAAMSGYDLWEAHASFLELAGNTYWQLEGPSVKFKGPPRTITPLRPDAVRPVCAPDGTPLRYEYWVDGQPTVLDASEVVHFKFFNPRHPIIGHSSVLASKTAILLDLWAVQWNKDFFQNGATVGPIINFRDEPGPVELRERMRAFNDKYSGPGRRQHEAHGISGDTDIKLPEQSHQDMGFYDGLKWTDSRVLMALGVPPVLVTLLAGSHYENTEAQIKVFWELCIRPKLRKRDATINRLLAPRYGAEYFVAYDRSAITALREALKDVVEVVRAFVPLGLMTPNEGRQYLATGDMPPLPALDGGDMAQVHAQLDAGAGPQPGTNTGLRTGRRESVARVIREVEEAARARKAAMLNQAGAAFVKRRGVRVASHAPLLAKFMTAHFRDQEAALLEHVGAIVAGASAAPGGIMACAIQNGAPERFLNNLDLVDQLVRDIREKNKPRQRAVYQELVRTFGQQAMSDLGKAAAHVAFRAVSHNTLEFISVHALTKLTNLDATTADMVKARFRSQLVEAQLEGDNLLSTSKRIMESAIEGAFQSRRENATRIAQTETTAAYNFANHEAMVQSDVVGTKVWHNQGDGLVRGEDDADSFDHLDMEGVEVPLNSPFMVPNRDGTPEPLQYPGDPSGSAGNVINCRCVSLPGSFKPAGNASPTSLAAAAVARMAEPIFPKGGNDA